MAITVDWATKIISVPQADLTHVSGTLYELDTEWFKDELTKLEASVYGMPNLRILDHNTSYTVAGVTYARKVEIINGYMVQFENGAYSVRLVGSNNNIFDVENGVLYQNNVQVISNNAAGLIVKVEQGGTLLTPQQSADFDKMRKYHTNKMEIDANTNRLIVYDDNGVDIVAEYDLQDSGGNPNSAVIFKRIPV